MITSLTQIMPVLSQAVNDTADDMLERLQEIIQERVYTGGTWTNGWTDSTGRTNEFGENWNVMSGAVSLMTAEASLQPFGQLSRTPPFSHGSDYSSNYPVLDMETMAHIKNEGNSPEFHGFPATPATDFWDTFLTEADGLIPMYFSQHCRSLGLNVGAGIGWDV